jgi:hypothetical protein
VRTVGDLERGVSQALRMDTVALLAEALDLPAVSRPRDWVVARVVETPTCVVRRSLTPQGYADKREGSSIVTVPVVGAGGRSHDTRNQGSQRRSQRVLSEPAGVP